MNPIDPTWERVPPAVLNYGEGIVGTDPFETRLTFTIDGDDLCVTIDETLSIVAAVREADGADTQG